MKSASHIGKIGNIVSGISGWLTKHEGLFLYKAAISVKKQIGEIVEIGSFLGKSTIYLAQSGEHISAIDPHKGEFSGGKTFQTLQEFLQNLKRAGVGSLVTPIIKTSADAHKNWNRPVKMLFIDGLHDERHALEDYMLWSSHIIDGGIIAMHDAFCGWEGAGNVAMRYIVYNPEYGEIGVIGSIIFGVRKKTNFLSWIIKLFRQCIIELSQFIYRISFIPKWTKFILVHRVLRFFLINRFTSFS